MSCKVLYSQPAALLDAFDASTLLTIVVDALDEDKIRLSDSASTCPSCLTLISKSIPLPRMR